MEGQGTGAKRKQAGPWEITWQGGPATNRVEGLDGDLLEGHDLLGLVAGHGLAQQLGRYGPAQVLANTMP